MTLASIKTQRIFRRPVRLGLLNRRVMRFSPLLIMLFGTIIAAFISSSATAADTPPIISEIRQQYQICRSLRSNEVGLVKMYGVYTDLETQERPVWHLSPPANGMILSEILLYKAPGQKIGFAELSEFTPSGDWSKATEYCYRLDGSLAFIFSEYRTFYGNVRVEDRLYYNRSGEQVRNIRRIFNLDTGERLPDGFANFMDRKAQIFRSVDDLASELGTIKPDIQTPVNASPVREPTNNQTAAQPAPSMAPVLDKIDAAGQNEIRQLVSGLIPEIEGVVSPHIKADLATVRGSEKQSSQYTFLANAAYINQHDEIAAWFFAQGILAGAMTPQALNNLAVALEDSYLVDAENRPDQWLNSARTLLTHALSISPNDALIINNLGWNAYRLSQKTGDAALLDEAVRSMKKAIAIEAGRPLFHAHLAELYLARGENDLAGAALARAHQLNSADPAFLSMVGKPGWSGAPAWSKAPRNHCNINYECLKTCPVSIIGRLKVITCEFSQADARSACGAGKPYAKTYRCEEEIPEYGILIPGLNSGLSIVTPYGRIDLTINGAGKVNYRVKGGPKMPGNLGVALEARGTYTKEEGVKVQRLTPKISVNIPTGTAAGQQLNQLGMGPMTLSATDKSGGTVNIESFDSTLWAH